MFLLRTWLSFFFCFAVFLYAMLGAIWFTKIMSQSKETTGEDGDDRQGRHLGAENRTIPTQPPAKRTRILCWIMTDPNDLDRRTRHVRDTWASRCDVTLFMSSAENRTFPTIGLNVTAGRSHIGAKSRAAWTYIHKHHLKDADYFVKADPDSYIVVENLRAYLSTCDPERPEFFGHMFGKRNRKYEYMSGGPGQILSREALRRMVEVAFVNHTKCFPDGQAEDMKTGHCLYLVGVRPRDTHDVYLRETMLIFKPQHELLGRYPKWYIAYDPLNGTQQGPRCCSDFPVSFHYISSHEMYLYDYILYSAQHSLDGSTQPPQFYDA